MGSFTAAAVPSHTAPPGHLSGGETFAMLQGCKQSLRGWNCVSLKRGGFALSGSLSQTRQPADG